MADYLASYSEAQSSVNMDFALETPDFLALQSDPADTTSHASIWQQALARKNELISQRSKETKTDRTGIIRSELAAFEKIQRLSQERDSLVSRIEKLAESKSSRTQQLVAEVLNQPKTYLNFEKLADQLSSGESMSSVASLSKLIDVDRMVADAKAGRGATHLKARVFDTLVDVESLENAKL